MPKFLINYVVNTTHNVRPGIKMLTGNLLNFFQKLAIYTIISLTVAACGSGYSDQDPYEPENKPEHSPITPALPALPERVNPFLELEHAKKQISNSTQ
jgi:hypothetical protein